MRSQITVIRGCLKGKVHQASILFDSLWETEMATYTYSVGAYHYVNTLALLQQLPLPPSPLPLTPPPLPLVLPLTQPTVSLCCDEPQQDWAPTEGLYTTVLLHLWWLLVQQRAKTMMQCRSLGNLQGHCLTSALHDISCPAPTDRQQRSY